MDLYFSPLACSMASRVVFYEAGEDANFIRVDTAAGRTADGADYAAINPMGLVPALRTDDGEVLTENTAILQYLGERFPQAGLLGEGFDRARVAQWLGFIGTELHASVFHTLFSRTASAETKAFTHAEAVKRMSRLEAHLAGRTWLLDRFTVADAYLAVVLNWAQFVQLDLTAYPNIAAFLDRARARPSIAKALGDEMAIRQAA